MSPPLSRRSAPSIAVFRALQLGDMLCVVPVFRALRAAYPDGRITLIGLPWAAAFAARYAAYIDDFVAFPGHPSLPEREPDPAGLEPFLADMRARRFDLAIQLHGSGPVVNAIVEAMAARRTAGFFLTAADHAPGGLYRPWPATGHEIERFLSIIPFLGLPVAGTHLEFPLSPADEAEADALLDAHGLAPGDYAVVHPGARLRSRRWPTDRFAAVADALMERGLQVLVTGSRDESALASAVVSATRRPAIDIAGETSFGAMAAVVGRARLLVSNDTGVSHIAAAMKTPSVIVTMGSDPARWAPMNAALHKNVFEPVSCRPCAFELCPIGHPCALAVTPDAVIRRVEEHLNGRKECVRFAS